MISNRHKIVQYLHCGLCIHEAVEQKISPRDYQQVEVGWTEKGLQVWCKRHDCNVVHVDFEGEVHPANTTRHLT